MSKGGLEDNLPQMFEYLRLLCLEHHLPQLHGMLTNYQEWIFVSYSLEDEVRKVYNGEAMGVRHIKKLVFDIGDQISLRDDNHVLQKEKLRLITRMIIDSCQQS